jgi:hypothetical protein
MRVLKTKLFQHWTKEIDLMDQNLIDAVHELKKGLYDAKLGGHIYKKRIAINNQGKRGGARTIIAFKAHDKAIFIYGYAKNKRSNITDKEEKALKALATEYFSYSETQINKAIKLGELIEVKS